MPQRSVELTDHFDQFIDSNIASGRFQDAGEILREGLRLLERQEREDQSKLNLLRAMAKDAFDSLDRGEGLAFRSMDELEAHMRGVGLQIWGQEALASLE